MVLPAPLGPMRPILSPRMIVVREVAHEHAAVRVREATFSASITFTPERSASASRRLTLPGALAARAALGAHAP